MFENQLTALSKSSTGKTLSLLNFDGTDEMSGGQLVDGADSARLWTLSAGTTIQAGEGRFGGSALWVNKSAGLIVPHNAGMDFSDFTLEMFFKRVDATKNNMYFSKSAPEYQGPYVRNWRSDPFISIGYTSGGNTYSEGQVVDGWNHFAFQLSPETTSVYLNGLLLRSVATGGRTWGSANANNFRIGSNNRLNASDLESNFLASCFRMTKGPRYSGSTYTVPTGKFELD